MAPGKFAEAVALSHSLAFQRNVRSSLSMEIGLHSLRRIVDNSSLVGKNDPSVSQGLGIIEYSSGR
jgi:hypothetical protein